MIYEALLAYMKDRVGQDVSIHDMFIAAYGPAETNFSNRVKQQALGPSIQRINLRIGRKVLIPGDLKGTYRLIEVLECE